jgi:FKBP-type peptidyl-prolyl cis-trans isomerase
MHHHRKSASALLSLACLLAGCHKDQPAPAPPANANGTEELSAPVQAGTEVTASPTPAKPEATAESAPAAAAPAAEAKPAAGDSALAAKPDEKPPAASTEEPASESKKPAKKKPGDKVADAPAKEAKPKFTELGVSVTKTGSGVAATAGKRVTLNYKASLADAEKPFDSTFASNRPLEVDLAIGAKLKVIEGLRRGLEGLTPGSEARLQIPANLAWGEKGDPAVGVPANADVVFEVQVLDVQ